MAAIDPEEGAATSVFLASDAKVARMHGRYFIKCAPADTSEAAQDRAAAERLWRESERLTGLEPAEIPKPLSSQHIDPAVTREWAPGRGYR